VTASKPPADTLLPTTPETSRPPQARDDDVPRWLVALLIVLVAAALISACVLSAAGLEAWQFFHHQNGIIGGQR
jgi:hypothetical protein